VKRVGLLLGLLLVLAWPVPLFAEPHEGLRWEGVGELEIDGAGFCTGAMISEDIVLTAAHCLFDPATGARLSERRIAFRAGWRNQYAAAFRGVRDVAIPADFIYEAAPDAHRLSHDIALLRLVRPIRSNQAVPFEVDSRPPAGEVIGIVAYEQNGFDVPEVREMCRVEAWQDPVLVMSCEVDFGVSGAPVFAFTGQMPRIVSMVSAKAAIDGVPVALGTDLKETVLALKRALGR